MNAERLRQIEELYHSAREREPGQRSAFLAEACRGDDELRRKVELLLAQDVSNDDAAGEKILDRPAWEAAPSLLGRPQNARLTPGTQIGPYKIEAALGAGGMGEVYRAVDTRLKRTVAIKVAKENFGERFEREARAIAALNHPNICTLYDVGPNYLVMELIEGPTLAERIEKGPVPLEEALGIAKQIADALEAAHEKGITHRDLKPGNVKIKPDGTVKVLDFGLAKVAPVSAGDSPAEATATLTTRAGMILGTADYMSPEQARGEPVDRRADIWAFGVVLYEMLTGTPAFARETASDTLAAVLKDEPEWNRVPQKAQRLLRRCLEKDPKHRLRDIGDLDLLLQAPTPQAKAQCHLVFLPSLDGKAVAAAPHLAWVGPAFGAPGKSASGHQVDHPVKFLLLLLGRTGRQDLGIAIEHEVASVGEAQLPWVDLGALRGLEHDRAHQVVSHHRNQQFLFHHVRRVRADAIETHRLLQAAQIGFDPPAAAIQRHHLLDRQRCGRKQIQPLLVLAAAHATCDQAPLYTGICRPGLQLLRVLLSAVPPAGPPTDRIIAGARNRAAQQRFRAYRSQS